MCYDPPMDVDVTSILHGKNKFQKRVFLSDQEPIRSEIFGLARLETHGESLALAQKVTSHPGDGEDIAPRVRDNRKVLEASYTVLLDAVEAHRAVTPAAEWLIDNFHIVRAQLKDIHDHLPPRFYKELPKLADGPLKGFPRVYGIAWAFIAHTDSRFDPELLKHFLAAYQRVQPLRIGELWAVSITLRAVLIENLRRLAARIAGSQLARRDADRLADEVLGLGLHKSRPMRQIIAELEKTHFSRSFAVQLLQRLRFQDVAADPVLEWLYERLKQQNLVADELVAAEHTSQTSANATVRNIVTSSRLMSVFDWRLFFEEVSLVHRTLRQSPGYCQMDFTSRDRYRHGLEELAKHSPHTELKIAEMVIARCEQAQKTAVEVSFAEERATDPGYYLISSGRRQFEKEIQFVPSLAKKAARLFGQYSSGLYIGAILVISVLILGIAAADFRSSEVIWWHLTWICAIAFFPASEVAIAVVNRAVVALMGPRYLPRLNFEGGIPDHLKTFVVVPTLISKSSGLAQQLEQLETHYLANPQKNLRFALLTDWTDSDVEMSPKDQALIVVAREKLFQLNARVGPAADGENLFYIFHRKRLFNEQEGKWMGWERKRGKLEEFNKLLLGEEGTSYIPLDGAEVQVPQGVRYVITLDADTKLPLGAAEQLVGTMAHPLNRAYVDERLKRVVQGYGILQPRITPALPSTQDSTLFQKISAGPSGIDPYASVISDVYQDLFEEGSYIGKGIYDVSAFASVLEGRVPENSLLSHDLFEGTFARCGFVSDIEFFEDFPSHSGVFALRSHRWTRGDWQLIPWILGLRRAGIPLIGRWKMLDNLRRSLVAPMTFLLIGLAFTMGPGGLTRWLALALASLFVPAVMVFITDVFPAGRSKSLWEQLQLTFKDFSLGAERAVVNLIFLPYRSWVTVDAILRALYRLYFSHKKLLEWTTAAQAKSAASHSLRSFWLDMRGGLYLTALAAAGIVALNFSLLPSASGFLILWFLSPILAHRLSLPPKMRPNLPVSPEDIDLLTVAGRRIWRFFATFVTAEENYLPPDNFQEDPHPVIAHRSSPTNFGLYLLSVIAARDFGWIGTLEMGERLNQTLKSLIHLPKHHGHFFNWYETTGARPLEPKYISSVDNGNLAGHLIAVGYGCVEKLSQPIDFFDSSSGVLSTLSLVKKAATAMAEKDPDHLNLYGLSDFLKILNEMEQQLKNPNQLVLRRSEYWPWMRAQADHLLDQVKRVQESEAITADASYREWIIWTRALKHDVDSRARDVLSLVSWMDFAQENPFSDAKEEELWKPLQQDLCKTVALSEIPAHCDHLIATTLTLKRQVSNSSVLDSLLECLDSSKTASLEAVRVFTDSYKACHKLFREMDFKMLYDPHRKLFSIGLRVSDNALDPSYYDLLASEARLTSFIAIAKGDVPVSHWFSLGRALTPVENGVALISWSGSMFEYLMPSLVMQSPPGSLLEQTCQLVIRRQIDYGKSKGVPWGVSESAYNKRDLDLTYQYSNFGVPNLGLKRGLGADLVIAPYASFLAALFDSASAAQNLRAIVGEGGYGPYGFYESIDYTASRLPQGSPRAVIRAYMAHHQGMSLVALANIFIDGSMQKRFHAEALIQATELLLQERTPRNVGTINPNQESFQIGIVREVSEPISRTYHSPNRPVPTTLLLSDGNYTVMLTSAGSGFSRFGDLALTRWREDVTQDHWGQYFFLKDTTTNRIWSAGHQPTAVTADSYEVTFTEDRATFKREDNDIACQMEVYVSPEDSAEIRKLTLTNLSDVPREIELTSYCEVVLNSQAADVAHPAFSNLFVQTEYIGEHGALLATRRPRSSSESPMWMAQVILRGEGCIGGVEFETDRAKFLGRGRSLRSAKAIYGSGPLSNTVGAVLDPVFSLRTKVRLEPGVSSSVIFSTLVAPSRNELLHRVENFQDRATFERATQLAWTQAQIKLHYLNIEPVEAHQFQRLATRLIFSDPSLRPSGDVIKRNKKNVTGLWAHGISGDFPIVLLRIDDMEDRGIVRQLLKAQEYLATKRLAVDLVILNEKANSYTQELQNLLESMVHSSMAVGHSPLPQSRGKVFILRPDILPPGDLDLLYAEARATLSSRLGNLAEQVKRMRHTVQDSRPRGTPAPISREENLPIPELDFFNGVGGFSKDGREYIVVLKEGLTTPAPWINVIANPGFGFQVSESGSSYTWCSNSRENQITPWSNDPVCDPSGEAFYIQDRETDLIWSPTANPIRRENAVYVARHTQGYSRFEHLCDGIASDLVQCVDPLLPVKISRLTLENRSSRERKLSVSGYVEWVLGFSRATMAPSTVSEYDESSKSLFAFNRRNPEYGDCISFFAVSQPEFTFTADRTEFIGRNGVLSEPRGIFNQTELHGRVGAGLDPCAAIKTDVTLKPGQKAELCFWLGQGKNREHSRDIISQMRAKDFESLFKKTVDQWDEILEKVQVQTPDRALDLMLNRWLLYQTLVCRVWARSAFYQAGGAFGFRDQLQDVMALTLSRPDLAREQILRAASRQFIEGDVQHWWHPPAGRGVRTHFSDDLLWLPFVVSHYIGVTGDSSVLEAEAAFLEGPLLRADQEDSYYTPSQSHHSGSIYEHCVRALDRSLKTGVHGLPLMGAGDWNDGMNRVGKEGKGESVWMGWFLYANLISFAQVAKNLGDEDHALKWQQHADRILSALENQAWDGQWYRRAFYDDGTPLGSAESEECRIDSLAQTWAVISKAGNPARAKKAMESLEKFLVLREQKLVLLFTPAFDQTPKDPGYIKGYLPGVRENGGQYTHAAAWAVIAFAMLSEGEKAWSLLKMLNPVNHTLDPEGVRRYKIEPYVLAGDVYSQPQHLGRGGWSWYTGSSGWIYRAALESVLGFKVQGQELCLRPCVVAGQEFPEGSVFKIRYRHGRQTFYSIEIRVQKTPVSELWLDGVKVHDIGKIALREDQKNHHIGNWDPKGAPNS